MRNCVLSLAVALVFALRGVAQSHDDRAVVEKLVLTLKAGNDYEKRKAIEAIGNLSATAKDAVPALTRIVTEYPGGELDALAIVALAKIGPPAQAALPVLRQRAGSMFNGDREPVESACVAIGRIGAWSPDTTRSILPLGMGNAAYFAANPDVTLPHLFNLLSDNDAKARLDALSAWRRLAEDRDTDVLKKRPQLQARVVEHAARTMGAKSALERRHAADLFRTLVPGEADKIIPVLVRLLKERAITWRDLDRSLSGRSESDTVHDDLRPKALPLLVAAFADASPEVHWALVEYLSLQEFHHSNAWLLRALADKSARIRAGAAAVTRRALPHEKVLEALRGMLKDPELPVRFQAAATLVVYDRKGDLAPVRTIIIEGLRAQDVAMCRDAAAMLRQIQAAGRDAVPATPALLDALGDPDTYVRLQSAEVLIGLGGKHAQRVVPVVQGILREESNYDYLTRAFDLANKLGKDAAPLVPELITHIETDSQWVGRAAQVLEKMAPEGKAAIPALQKRLQAPPGIPSLRDRAHVCVALARLGAPDHARATRVLLPFAPRTEESFLLAHYLPLYPNETMTEMAKLLPDATLRPMVLKTLTRTVGTPGRHGEQINALEQKLTPQVKDDLHKALTKVLDEKDLTTRIAAMTAMRNFHFKPAPDKLAALVRDCVAATEIHAATMCIEGNEKTLIPVLIEEAAKQDDPVRYYSVFSSARPAAIPVLLDIVRSDSSRQCVQAAWGLAGLSYLKMTEQSRAEATATLIARLPELKSPARGEVAMAILNINRKAPPRAAIVAVGEHMLDKDVKTPGYAVAALRDLGRNAAPALEHLRRALTHQDAYVRLEAASLLVVIDKKHAAEILPVVRKTLDMPLKEDAGEGNGYRGTALHICMLLGPDARPALPRLLEISRSREARTAILASQAAVAIDKDNIPKVANNLAQLLAASKRRNRHELATVHELLRAWGKAAAEADEHLTPLLRLDRDSGRFTVAVSLIMMQGPNADKGVEQMRRNLRVSSDSYGGCSEALHQFAILKSHGKVFLPELRKLLDSPNPYDREEAVRAIGAIGPDAKELLPELRRRLAGKHADAESHDLKEAIKKITPLRGN
jgi:HEAT repeat protein